MGEDNWRRKMRKLLNAEKTQKRNKGRRTLNKYFCFVLLIG